MAITRQYLLDLLERVKKIDSTQDWETLSASEKNLLEEFAVYYGAQKGIDVSTGYDVLSKLKDPKAGKDFLAIVESLESIEAAFDEVTVGTIPPEILAEYQEYLKQAKQQAAAPGVVSPQKSLAATIKKAQYFYQLRLKVEAARVAHYAVANPNLDPTKDAAVISSIAQTEVQENNQTLTTAVSQQKDPIEVITKPVATTSATYVEKVAASLNLTLTPSQKDEAVLTLAALIYSGGVEDLVDPLADTPDQALVPAKINPASQNLVAAASYVLSQTVNPTPPSSVNNPFEKATTDLESFFRAGTVPADPKDELIPPALSPEFTHQVESISTEIIQNYLALEALQDASRNVYQVQLKCASAGLSRYSSVDLPFLNPTEIETVIRAYQHDHPGELVPPNLFQTYGYEKASAAIKTADPSDKKNTSAIEAHHRGIHLAVIQAIAKAEPGSELDKLAKQRPGLVTRVISVVHPIENSRLGQSGEISTPTPTGPKPPSQNPLRRAFDSTLGVAGKGLNKFVDSVSSRSPALGRALNFIRTPIQSALRPIFAWAGRQAGVQAARQFLQNVAAKAIEKIASEGVKKVAQTLVSQGLKEGLKALLIQGAAALGIDIAVGATGVGIPLALIMLLAQLALLAIGMAVDFIKKNNKEIGEQIVGAGVLFSTAISGLFSGMVALAAATGMTLVVITIFSIIFGTTIYIAIYNVAPIISTVAQLDSGLGAASGGTAENFVPIPGISCGATLPPENNTTSNPVAKRAYEVVTNLNKGFWNYCNNHPDYPELFNTQLFKLNPNPPYPGPIQNSAANLFWCTWLTAKAYGFAPGNSFAADGQMRGVNFQDIAGLRYTAVQPGDIIFINVNKSSRVANHVGVVYSVNEDAIVYLQSNAATKTANVPVRTDGTIQDEIGRIAIIGFGRP